MEEWRDIKGYEGLYQVSNSGKVKSLKDNYGRPRIKILKLKKRKDGYIQITLHKNGERKTFRVHQLVAKAFIPNPDNLPEVNHKDKIRTNNRVDNLEWCTRKYNNNYGARTEKFIESRGTKVICVNTGKIYRSTREASRDTGVDNSFICKCCKGKYKSAGKHPETGEPLVWKYI